MNRRTACQTALRFAGLALLMVAATATVHADYYTVTLTNGTSFQTRYRPEPAEWDDNVVMINTDRGNWIGLLADDIADVTSHAEATGFGYQLDTTTLFVGWSPNEDQSAEEGAEGEGGAGGGLNLEEMFPEPPPSGVLEQFIDIPGVSGGSLGSQAADNIYDQ